MDINIMPALQIEDRKNLSAEEFQKQLCSWLESRGLLCELRAYFRSNMIEVLKNTALGTSISSKMKQPISPKKQAINLLISEYFIYSQYHFSLCVFCTEVQLSHMLSDITDTTLLSKAESKFKFSEKEVYDILEAVGLLKHNRQAQKIYAAYCEVDQPLLSYFLPSNSVSNIASNEEIGYVESGGDIDCEIINNNINRIIDNSNLSPNEISEIKSCIKLLSTKEKEKQTKLLEELKDQYRSQLKKYKNKLFDIQGSFEKERKKFQDDLSHMNQELASVLFHNKILKRNEPKTYDISEIANLIKELQTIEAPTNKESKPSQVKDKGVQCICEKPTKKSFSDQEQQTMANTSLESAVLKHVVQQLEKENNHLRGDNFNYCEQIDELANRASILMNELNISQQNVVRLNNLLQNTPSVFVPSSTNERKSLHYTGGGEQCSGANVQERTRRNYRHLTTGNRSITSRKSIPSPGTSSDSTSRTDDILREAKKRLKNLEIESEHIDRKMINATDRFYNFSGQIQNKTEREKRDTFKFNTESAERKVSEIFEFGCTTTSVQSKESMTDLECPSSESRTTVNTGSTSVSQLDLLQRKEED